MLTLGQPKSQHYLSVKAPVKRPIVCTLYSKDKAQCSETKKKQSVKSAFYHKVITQYERSSYAPQLCEQPLQIPFMFSVVSYLVLNSFEAMIIMSIYSSRQAVIKQLSGSCQAVVKQLSESRQAVVRQSSGSRQSVIRQSSGNRQAVIRQSSGSRQAVVRHLSGSVFV